MANQEETGVVKWFDAQKGYGFITRSSGEDIFVHFSNVEEPDAKSLQEGDRVVFEVGPGRKGPAAHNVRRVSLEE